MLALMFSGQLPNTTDDKVTPSTQCQPALFTAVDSHWSGSVMPVKAPAGCTIIDFSRGLVESTRILGYWNSAQKFPL